MIQNDEAPQSSSSSESEAALYSCVKCETSYSSEVEFGQHLLLHIERSYPVVTFNKNEVDRRYLRDFDNKNKMSAEGGETEVMNQLDENMSPEGETEMDPIDEVVDKKPILNNNFESHGDSNNESSMKDEERPGSVSGDDDDSMSICSSIGASAKTSPKKVIKAEVHAPDIETVPKEEAKVKVRRSSESSQGKGQSGAEDEDDRSKSPVKLAITVRKPEDLMAQTNYTLIQKRLQELYSRCQGKGTQERQPTGLSLLADTCVTGRVSSDVRAVGSKGNEAGSSQVSRTSHDQLVSSVQRAVAHSSSNVNETQDDYYDSTPKLSECGTESSCGMTLTPTVNAEIDAVLKDIDFSRLPDQVDGGVDSDNDMNLHITSEDCDWPDDIEEQPDNQEYSGKAAEPIPPPAPKPKIIGPKPKISDYFSVTRKSSSNTKSPTDDTQFQKKQPRNVPEQFSSKQEKEMSMSNSNEYNFGSTNVTDSQGNVKNPGGTSITVTPTKRYTSFEGVLDDANPQYDDIDESGSGPNSRRSMHATNIQDHVPTSSIRKSVSLNVSSDAGPRTTRATTISKHSRRDSMLDEGSRWGPNLLQNTHAMVNSSMRTQQKCEQLKPVMTDRCGIGSQNAMKSAECRQLRHILTDTAVKVGGGQMENRTPTYQKVTADNPNQADRLKHDVADFGRIQSNKGTPNSGIKLQNRPQSSMATDLSNRPNLDQEVLSNPTNSVGQLSQESGSSMDARYGEVVRKLGRGISLSVAPSKKDLHMSDQELGKRTSTHQGTTGANINRTGKLGYGGSNPRKARSNKVAMNSGIKAQICPQASMAADFTNDHNLDKEATRNPTDDDHLSQLDSASGIAGYDQDTRNSSREISVSSSASNDQHTNGQKMQVFSHFHQGVTAANYNQTSKIERGGANIGQAQSTRPAMSSGRNAVNRPQSSMAADVRGDPNSDKEATSNPNIDGCSQLDSATVISGYDQDRQNLNHEISMSLSGSMNKHPLTDQEIDDMIASALQGRTGMTISKTASLDQQFLADQESRSQRNRLQEVSQPKANSDSTQLEHHGLEAVDIQDVAYKQQHPQPSNPSNRGNQSRDVEQNQNSRKAKRTNRKRATQPQRKTAPNFKDGENSVFEAQLATDSSSDIGSQIILPTVIRNNPDLASADLQESKDPGSDSSMPEIKIPNLPPFFEAFPSVPASVVGKKFADILKKRHTAASQETPGTSQMIPGAPHLVPVTSKVTPGVFRQPTQLPPPAPTPGAAPRVAVPTQRSNKDWELRMRRRRMWRRADMRRKKISLKLSKHLPNATKNTKKKYGPILSDSGSCDSFEVEKKRKLVTQDLGRSSSNSHVKASEGEKPQDFMDGLFSTGLSPPKPLTPVSVSTSGTFTPGKSYTNLQPLDNSYFQDPPNTAENPSHPYPSQKDFTNGDFHNSQKDLFRCAICPRSFVTAAELEAHTVAEGHIICSMSEACASLQFDSLAALSHHQGMVHQAPIQTTAVQRLAAQVERLPQTFGSYPPQGSPQHYGGNSPYNLPSASYNGPKLGSQVVLTPMSSPVVAAPRQPSPNIPNLPGIQVTKRPAPSPADSSPNKMIRGDNGMTSSIRLPDSITLIKSAPAPPPQNAVADMLATRGITVNPGNTMVASGSRAGPTPATSIQPVAPAKRLPNVPSAISIVPSRAQPPQQAQRFAVPPAPQQRGRHMSNLGTVDLTRDDSNSRMRGPGRPMSNNSPRRFSCTICDKVYPTGESLQAHMAVHGSTNKSGRYMCDICRVVYTNDAKLQHHKRTVHAVRGLAEAEMVVPVCDMNQPGVKEKLLQCGIRHVAQVHNMRNTNDTAVFGLPIIPIDFARNEAYSRLDDLGASNVLSLGNLINIYR